MLLGASPALAYLSNSDEGGFTVTHVAQTAAEPAVAWHAMTSRVNEWWSGDHSWSGDAANLYIDLGRNGCFCENLPDGGHVEHLGLIYLAPNAELRFNGELGPLQSMPVSGRMIWKIEKLETGSSLTFTYHVTGRPEGGLAGIAPAVDGVIGEQLGRLVGLLTEE
jgi:hypothetical protein